MTLEGKLSVTKYPWVKNLFLFLFIVGAHIWFKTLYLNNSGLWYDEVVQLFYSQQDWGLIKHTSEWNRNAPLYYYFLYIWRNLFGYSEVALRLSSVIFSSLAAGLLFITIKRHFGKLAAAITLLLFSFSNEAYFYSQEVSVHSIIIFLTVASFYFYFDLLNGKSVFALIMLSVCNFLLVYGQYITSIVPVLQFVSVLLLFRKDLFKRIGLSFVLTVLLSAWRFTYKNVHFVLFPDASSAPVAPTFDYLRHIVLKLTHGEMFFWIFTGIVLLCAVYLVFTKRLIYQERGNNIKIASVFLVGVGGILICYTLYFLMVGFAIDQFIFLTPLLFSFIGIMASRPGAEVRYAIAGATIFLSLCFFLKLKMNVKKPMDYRTAMFTIKQVKKNTKDIAILVETRDIGYLFAYYYDQNIFKDYKGIEERLKSEGIFLVSTKEDVEAIGIERFDKVLLVQTYDEVNPGNKEMLERIGRQLNFYVNYWGYDKVHLTIPYCKP